MPNKSVKPRKLEVARNIHFHKTLAVCFSCKAFFYVFILTSQVCAQTVPCETFKLKAIEFVHFDYSPRAEETNAGFFIATCELSLSNLTDSMPLQQDDLISRKLVATTREAEYSHPIVGVSIFEAMHLCNLLSQHFNMESAYLFDFVNAKPTNNLNTRRKFGTYEKLRRDQKGTTTPTVTINRANGFRLPSTLEWFAVRYMDCDNSDANEYRSNISAFPAVRHLLPTRCFAPSKNGLYDIFGNAEEICVNILGNDGSEASGSGMWNYSMVGGCYLSPASICLQGINAVQTYSPSMLNNITIAAGLRLCVDDTAEIRDLFKSQHELK